MQITETGDVNMQDLLLLAVLAVIFVLGRFLMKGLDNFLERNRQEQDSQIDPDMHCKGRKQSNDMI